VIRKVAAALKIIIDVRRGQYQQNHMNYRISLCFAAALFGACKTTPEKENPETKAERIAIKCENSPPIRVEYREDGKTVESEGPIDTGGQNCDEIAKNKMTAGMIAKNGKWTNYHVDGKIMSTGNFLAGKRDGQWSYFSESGNLTKVASFNGGKSQGEEITYFDTPDRLWKSRATYANGVKNGAWSERRAIDSTCVTEGSWANGVKIGKWRECKTGPDKVDYLAFEGSFENGMRNGAVKFFYPGAVVQSQGVMQADADCVAKLSDTERQEAARVEACGKPVGKWVFNHANGSRHSEGSYDNGRKTGAWKEYYKTGAPVASGSYADNKRLGLWAFLDKSGARVAEIEFAENGITPKIVKLYKSGKLVGSGEVMMGHVKYDMEKDELDLREFNKKGLWTEYHENGKKSGEGEYTMNKRKGSWKHYDESGKLIAEGSYSMGEKQGAWKELSGGAMVEKTYFMGKLKGGY